MARIEIIPLWLNPFGETIDLMEQARPEIKQIQISYHKMNVEN